MDDTLAATTLGGTTLSAGLADSQSQLAQAWGATGGFGADSIAQFESAYRTSGGGPTLALLGLNPFQIVATGAFHELFWGAIVIFLGVASIVSLQRTLIVRHNMGSRHPLASVAQVYFRLLTGVLLVSNTPLVYACLMTVNGALGQAMQSMASQSMSALFQTGSMGTLSFAQARIDAIRSAAARRAMALYPAGASRDEMTQIALWYNATAGAINAALSAQNLSGALPTLNPTWDSAQTPDDQVTAYVGRSVVQNFAQLVADLGALGAGSGPLSVAFPSGGPTSLGLLSDALASDDQAAAQAIAMPDTPSSNAAFESARALYARNVLSDTLSYLDTQVLPVIGASPTLANRAKAWFSEKVEQAAASATGFMSQWRAAVDWIGRGIGVVLTRMIAFLFNAGVAAMIEVELFVLVVAVPFWLLPATEDAFQGVLRSLISLTLAVPAYQFIMLFVDALMGLVLKYFLFGTLASGLPGAAAAAGGAAHLVVAALAVVGSGGEIVPLVTFCYLTAYLFLAIYFALKTPKLLSVFMKGAGAGGFFLSQFATGLISGTSAAIATASVGSGGGLPARLLGGSPGRVPMAAPRGSGRPDLGKVVASSPAQAHDATITAGRARPGPSHRAPLPARQPPAAGPGPSQGPGSAPDPGRLPGAAPAEPVAMAVPWRTTAAFGFRTFVDCLQADSPADGIQLAAKALQMHQKHTEKEAEARHKALAQAEKESAGQAKRTPRTKK